jgi:hypothetical protein
MEELAFIKTSIALSSSWRNHHNKGNGFGTEYVFLGNCSINNVDWLGLDAALTSTIISTGESAFQQLCNAKKHCNCPHLGNIWIVITLGSTSFQGCVGQTQAAWDAYFNQPYISGTNPSYSETWIYVWDPEPHNYLQLFPTSNDLSSDASFYIDFWAGTIQYTILMPSGEYQITTIQMKCDPFTTSTSSYLWNPTGGNGYGPGGSGIYP